MADRIDAFLKLLASGQDTSLLRFSLGNEYLAADQPGEAVTHLQAAVEQDAGYSAAWKLLGKARVANDDPDGAAEAYRQGIAAAEEKGDRQAAKEMQVFLKRLEKESGVRR
ncbi:MAG: hypothetical protein U5K76_14530 [Woeseiaceae bacterium]|nr:hypothetical protein [Woeseiaceae bacterium]